MARRRERVSTLRTSLRTSHWGCISSNLSGLEIYSFVHRRNPVLWSSNVFQNEAQDFERQFLMSHLRSGPWYIPIDLCVCVIVYKSLVKYARSPSYGSVDLVRQRAIIISYPNLNFRSCKITGLIILIVSVDFSCTFLFSTLKWFRLRHVALHVYNFHLTLNLILSLYAFPRQRQLHLYLSYLLTTPSPSALTHNTELKRNDILFKKPTLFLHSSSSFQYIV